MQGPPLSAPAPACQASEVACGISVLLGASDEFAGVSSTQTLKQAHPEALETSFDSGAWALAPARRSP